MSGGRASRGGAQFWPRMRVWLLGALCLCGLASGVVAAEWAYQAGPEPGRHAAFVCEEGRGAQSGQRLCFGLSCDARGAMRFGLGAEGDPDLLARPEVDVQAFAGWRVLAPLGFRSTGLGSFEAPFSEAHVAGLERLKAGAQMELRYWEAGDVPPVVWRLTLKGSRVAIEALEAVCPLPDFAAQARAARVSVDPAGEVLADMREACAALGGEVEMQDVYTESIDLDGQGAADLVLNHGALHCSTQEDLVCGPAGCLHSIWQAQTEGGYLRVFLNAVQGVTAAEPGSVRLDLKGLLCGRRGAGPCSQVWSLQGGELAPAQNP